MARLVFAVLAATMLSAPTPPPTPAKAIDRPPQAERSGPKHSDKDQASIEPTLAPIDRGQTPQPKREPPNSRSNATDKRAADGRIVWFTGVLAFVGVMQLLAMLIQARLMNRAMVITRQAADAATASAEAARAGVDAAIAQVETMKQQNALIAQSVDISNQSVQSVAQSAVQSSAAVNTALTIMQHQSGTFSEISQALQRIAAASKLF